jgi:uncharacterized protein
VSRRDDLLALQEIDSALDLLQHRVEHLDERDALASASAALNALVAERTAAEAARSAAEEGLERVEADSAEVDRHRVRLEAQMKTIIAPREAEALQHEMATLAQRRSALDDAGLELLDAIASAETRRDTAVADEPIARQRVADADAALAAAEADLRHQIADFQPVRAAAIAALDQSAVAQYDAMRRQHRGVAVARLQGPQCTGCHIELSISETEQIRRVPDDQVPECPSCGRLLVP